MINSPDITTIKKALVDTFTCYAFLVFEVNRDECIINVWSKDAATEQAARSKYLTLTVTGIRNDNIIHFGLDTIRRTFATGQSLVIDYATLNNDVPVKSIIRTIPNVLDNDTVFVVVEQPETAKRLIEDKWKLALDASGDGIWDINLENNHIFFSDRWHEIFGYTPDEIQTRDDWRKKIHPEDAPHALKAYDDYISGADPNYVSELRYLCKDGSYKWILSRGVIAARDANGKPARFIGTHTDIHHRKQNERALEESEKRYKALFNYAEAMICTHDTDGTILSVNPFTRKVLGYTQEEMIGSSISNLIPAYLRDRFNADYLEKVSSEGSAEGIMRVISKSGEKRYLLYHNYLFENEGSKPYVIGFAQDITDRVQAEEALKSSRDTFSSVFNHSGIGIALLDTDGKWLDANPVVCNITGYEKTELLKMNFRDITHEEDVVKDLVQMRQMLERKIDTYTLEKRYLTKNGGIKWVSLTVSMVWKNSDTPAFFIAQIVDVTQPKLLRDKIDRQKKELEQSQANLIEKVKQLEEMSHIVAHNLRGPANNIKLLTETLKVKLGGTSDNENAQIISESVTEAEAADMIGKASDSLLNTLELLLSIAEIRLSGGIAFDHCDINEIIRTIQQQLQGNILESKAIINTHLDVPYVEYPKHYLENIFYNLISNAIKYRREGISPEILIFSEQQNGRTRIKVKDNGSGLDMERFGNKLFRLNQVFHRNKDSKGIGLFLVRNQVESLGGKIQATSKVNEGSEFVVTL
jgi:PAS domain S-box-containing protein